MRMRNRYSKLKCDKKAHRPSSRGNNSLRRTSHNKATSRLVGILLSVALVVLEVHTQTDLVHKAGSLAVQDLSLVAHLLLAACLPTDLPLQAGFLLVKVSMDPPGPSLLACHLQGCSIKTRISPHRAQVDLRRDHNKAKMISQLFRNLRSLKQTALRNQHLVLAESRQEKLRHQLPPQSSLLRHQSTLSQMLQLHWLLPNSQQQRVHQVDQRVVASFPQYPFPAPGPPRVHHLRSKQHSPNRLLPNNKTLHSSPLLL